VFNAGAAVGYLKLNTTGWKAGTRSATASLTALSRTAQRFGMVTTASLLLIEREFGKFDKAIRHATSVSETTEAQFRQMSEMALDASVKWNRAAADTATAFYYLGSAGLTVTEQMQAFNDTIMLSRAMGSELASTVEGMVDIVRAFGLEFANSREIADQLTKTVISSNQHFHDLDRALAYASSTARMTNNTLAETAAMLGTMANAGIKGSMAGTVLRRAMTNLMSPTGAMSGLMYDLGLQVYDTQGRMKPFINIMGDISDRIRNTTEEYKNMVFEVLFGRRAIAGQIQLFNYGSGALRKYANEIRDAGGTTQRVADKQMKAFTEVLGQVWQQMRRISIMVGGTLAPAIERIAKHIGDNLKMLEGYIDANSDAIRETLKWVGTLGAALAIGTPLLLLVVSLTNQFVQLALAIGTVGIALATNPLTLLALALYTLRVSLNTDFWKQAWNNKIKPFLDVLGEGFTQTITQIMWEFSLIPDAIEKSFTGQTVKNSASYLMKALQQIGIMDRIAAQEQLGIFNPDAVKGKLTKLRAEYSKLQEEMRELLFGKSDEEGGVGAFHNVLFGSKEERNASYQKYKNELAMVGKELLYQGKEITVNISAAFKETLEQDFQALKDTLRNLVESSPALANFIGKAEEALDNIRKLVEAVGREPDPFWRKMSEDIEEFNIKLTEASKRWKEATLLTGGGAIKSSGRLADAWRNAARELFNPTEGEVKGWQSTFADTMGSIRSAWSDTMYNMMTTGGSLWDFLDNMFKGILNSFSRMIADIAANELLFTLTGYSFMKPGTPRFAHLFGGSTGGYSSGMPTPRMDLPGLSPYGPDSTPAYEGGLSMRKAIPVTINVENTGTPMNMRESSRHFDGKQWVINTVLEAYNTDPNVRSAMGG